MAVSNECPDLELIQGLQLDRNALSRFIEADDFPAKVIGCYVRVLLNVLPQEGVSSTFRSSEDRYFIARVRDTAKSDEYTGFSADGSSTKWYLLIDLPYSIRFRSNCDKVQLNTVSNSFFRPSEYEQWINGFLASGQSFPLIETLLFRKRVLEKDLKDCVKGAKVVIPNATRRRIEEEVRKEFVVFPSPLQVRALNLQQLEDIECQLQKLSASLRGVINERFKCVICQHAAATRVCYPCGHQVLCNECSLENKIICPIAGCNTHVIEVFEPISS